MSDPGTPHPERTLRLIFEYDGRRFVGWQAQQDLPSVEAELRAAVQGLTKEDPAFRVAGRTDAGVHAMGQVVSFKTHSAIPAKKFVPGLNAFLPNDVSVHRADEMDPGFDARRDSMSKIYRYRVYRSESPAALEGRAWHIRRPLDLAVMRGASRCLVGEHDLNAFRSAHCGAPHARRNIFSIEIHATPRPPIGEHVDLLFHANAYCRHTCRILAGTLVEVGLGKRTTASVAEALAGRDRTRAGVTAPPHGLTLMRVFYPDDPPPGVEPRRPT